jgi:dodecin
MSSNVYAISEIAGSSTESIEEAIENALARARKTLRNLDWFETTEIRGHLGDDGTVAHSQVSLKLGFKMEDAE